MSVIPQGEVRVMDGSMGRLCQLKGVPEDSKLWSARGLVEEQYHEIVIAAHMDYIRAGATELTTNNYAVQPCYYQRVFEDWQERIPKDTELAARLAVEARRRCGAEGSVRILGCLPPICESHRPDLTACYLAEQGDATCIEFYRAAGTALLRGGADALLAETLNSWDEARLAIEGTKALGLPLLVSMEGALRDDNMKPHPERAPGIAQKVLEAKKQGAPIEVLGFNCAPPEEIFAALQSLKTSGWGKRLQKAGIVLAAYANSNDRKAVHDAGFDVRKFITAGPIRVRKDLKGSGYVRWCHAFAASGAKLCGGCCGTTPEQIAEIALSFGTDSAAAGKHRLGNEISVSTAASEAEVRGSIDNLFGTVA